MRRSAVVISAAFGIGIFSAHIWDVEAILWLFMCTFAVAFFVYLKICNSDRKYLSMCLIMCFFTMGGMWLEAEENVFLCSVDQYYAHVDMEGVVIRAEEKETYNCLVIRSGGMDHLARYYGNADGPHSYIGDLVKISGEVSEPQGKRNPGCFDYSLYLKSCGIGSIINVQCIEIIYENKVPLLSISSAVREWVGRILSESLSQEAAGLIMAMVFGEKSGLDEELYNEFRETGTAHILAVSGLHVGIVYSIFNFLWRLKKEAAFCACAVVLLMVYIVIAGFSPSVMRAAVMILLHAASGLLGRRYDLLTSAAVTFMVMLADQPFRLFNTGFQLSFLAVSSLGVVLPYIKSFYEGIFLVSASIQLGMMPFTAYIFNYVSIAALIANVPVVIMASVLLPVALMLPAAALVSDSFQQLIAAVLESGCSMLTAMNEVFYMDGMTSFDVVSPPVWMIVLYYGSLFFFMSEKGQLMRLRKLYRQIIAVAAVIVIVSVYLNAVTDDGFGRTSIVFVDVGQGDCIHIKTDDGSNYLIDGGGNTNYDVGMKTLKPYLLKNGVRQINAAFVTHLHEDHYGSVRMLAADGMINRIGMYEANCLIEEKVQKETETELFYLYAGQRIQLGDDVCLEVLAPERNDTEEYNRLIADTEDENSACLIFRLIYRQKTVLITGDIDEKGENELVMEYGHALESDIVKVPHHGSRHSSSACFIEAADPDIAVFQVGKNNYGHPDKSVIKRYEKAGAKIFRNDEDGAVGLIIGKDGDIQVVKMLD